MYITLKNRPNCFYVNVNDIIKPLPIYSINNNTVLLNDIRYQYYMFMFQNNFPCLHVSWVGLVPKYYIPISINIIMYRLTHRMYGYHIIITLGQFSM